jgi:hypothetical protein
MALEVSYHGLLTVMISLMNSNTELCEDTTSFVFYTPLLLKLFLYVIRSGFNNFPEFAGTIICSSLNLAMNKEMCTDILRPLREAVRRKRHEKCRTNSWFLLHDNAPTHRSA